jgi:hypothetical protein
MDIPYSFSALFTTQKKQINTSIGNMEDAMSLGDVASDLPPFMLEALRKGRSEEGYNSILNKRNSVFYQPPNPILAYSSTDSDKVNWLPAELVEILESHGPTDGDIDDKGRTDPKKLEAAMHTVFRWQTLAQNRPSSCPVSMYVRSFRTPGSLGRWKLISRR